MDANYKREIEESDQNREMRGGEGTMGMPGSAGMGAGRRGGRRQKSTGGS